MKNEKQIINSVENDYSKKLQVNKNTKAVLFICDLTEKELIIKGALLFENMSSAYMAYSEIPNPESQLITGDSFAELTENLEKFYKKIKDPNWLDDLRNSI